MRWSAVILAACLAVPAQTVGARADALSDCLQASEPELRVRGCTEVIAGAAYSGEHKAVAYRNRGRARTEAGAIDAALSDLDAAIRLNGADTQAHAFRALARTSRGDVDGAIADYATIIALTPRSALGYNGRGHAFLLKRDAPAAIADFSEAIRLNPQSSSAHNNRGLAHRTAGDLARAVADYTTAIGLNPVYALAYANRGHAHEADGRRTEAIADFRNAILLDPSLAAPRAALQRLGNAGPMLEESASYVAAGKALVERHCATCHAVGASGASPLAKAPPFRTLHARHPMQSLREPLTRGIAAPHDEMPKFRLPDGDIDKVLAYVNSLAPRF